MSNPKFCYTETRRKFHAHNTKFQKVRRKVLPTGYNSHLPRRFSDFARLEMGARLSYPRLLFYEGAS